MAYEEMSKIQLGTSAYGVGGEPKYGIEVLRKQNELLLVTVNALIDRVNALSNQANKSDLTEPQWKNDR